MLIDFALLGSDSNDERRSAVESALAKLAPGILRARLRPVLAVDVTRELDRVDVPILYLRATRAPAWAKGAITKIVIEGQSRQSPIEIVDPEILDKFTIWSGPGVSGWDMINTIPKADDPKFIVDWTQGIVSDHPSGSRRYFVSMHIEGRKPPRNTYEVVYLIDSGDDIGYVYLPSYPKDNFGQWNTFQIYRGVEGNWFRPTKDWEEVVRSLVDKE